MGGIRVGTQPLVLDHLALHVCLFSTENSLESSQLHTCQVSGLHPSPKPQSVSPSDIRVICTQVSVSPLSAKLDIVFLIDEGLLPFQVESSFLVWTAPPQYVGFCLLLVGVPFCFWLLHSGGTRDSVVREDGTHDTKERCLSGDKNSRS